MRATKTSDKHVPGNKVAPNELQVKLWVGNEPHTDEKNES